MQKQIIKLIEQEDNQFKMECEMELIPLAVAEATVNQVAKMVAERQSNKCTNEFVKTKDGKLLFEAYMEVKHYKFWNRVLYITNILTVIYFGWRMTH